MRITTATVVAALAATALAAPNALAQPANTGASTPGQDLRSPDAIDAATRPDADAMRGTHADALRYQAEAAYYRHHRNDAPASKPAPAPTVHVTRLTDGGFDWADAGIGAGLTAALLLSAAGASALRRQHPATS